MRVLLPFMATFTFFAERPSLCSHSPKNLMGGFLRLYTENFQVLAGSFLAALKS